MNYNLKCDEAATRRIVEAVKPATLVAATKYTTADEMAKLEANGVTIFGENRVQDFLKKKEVYQGKAHWHFIGTLQTNKVKYIIDQVDMIHSVANRKPYFFRSTLRMKKANMALREKKCRMLWLMRSQSLILK